MAVLAGTSKLCHQTCFSPMRAIITDSELTSYYHRPHYTFSVCCAAEYFNNCRELIFNNLTRNFDSNKLLASYYFEKWSTVRVFNWLAFVDLSDPISRTHCHQCIRHLGPFLYSHCICHLVECMYHECVSIELSTLSAGNSLLLLIVMIHSILISCSFIIVVRT